MKPSPLHIVPQLSLLFFLLLQTLPIAISAIATPGTAAAESTAPVIRDPRFGLNQAWESPDAADRAGAGWSRLMFWWSALQPNGPNDWNDWATDRDDGMNPSSRSSSRSGTATAAAHASKNVRATGR